MMRQSVASHHQESIRSRYDGNQEVSTYCTGDGMYRSGGIDCRDGGVWVSEHDRVQYVRFASRGRQHQPVGFSRQSDRRFARQRHQYHQQHRGRSARLRADQRRHRRFLQGRRHHRQRRRIRQLGNQSRSIHESAGRERGRKRRQTRRRQSTRMVLRSRSHRDGQSHRRSIPAQRCRPRRGIHQAAQNVAG